MTRREIFQRAAACVVTPAIVPVAVPVAQPNPLFAGGLAVFDGHELKEWMSNKTLHERGYTFNGKTKAWERHHHFAS